jgi:hypothetical protein
LSLCARELYLLLMDGEDRVKTRFWRFSLRLVSTYCSSLVILATQTELSWVPAFGFDGYRRIVEILKKGKN